MIKVVVHGAQGKMGQEVLKALCKNEDFEIVGAIEKNIAEKSLLLPDGSRQVPFSSDLKFILKISHPDVMVDFTNRDATMSAVPIAAEGGVSLVIGTTGFSQADLEEIDNLCHSHDIGAVVAPNFSLGAVLMIHLAKIASKFFDYAEILEMHHENKLDAPSGTSLATAREMVKARGKLGQKFRFVPTVKECKKNLAGSRGAEFEGIALHSIRLPGALAHQEVIFGSLGETLKIRQDTVSRECYMPGVMLAIKEVTKIKGLIFGLEKLLDLEETS